MANKATLLAAATAAVLLAGTGIASAQVLADNPPGSAFQDRKNIEWLGYPAEAPYPPGAFHPVSPYGSYARAPYEAYAMAPPLLAPPRPYWDYDY
jgi:hypothetical protein